MKRALRVLIIDDNPEDRALMVRELGREFKDLLVLEITEAADFEEALDREAFDLVITDFKLRWSDGLKVLEEIKARQPLCPVIMVTEAGNEEIAVAAMKAGVDDYINKSSQYFHNLPVTVRLLLERDREKQARWKAEARYARLFDRVPVGLYRITLGGKILDANLALAELLGYGDREELLAVSAREYYAQEEDQQRWRQQMERDGAVRDFEVRLRRRDGSVIRVRNNAQAIRDDQGRIIWYEGSTEDITARKQAEEALKDSEAKYRLLFESNPQPMWVYDLETLAFLKVNQAAVTRYGYRWEEFLAMTIKDIRPPEDVPSLLQKVSQLPPGLGHSGEARHRKKSGEIMDVEIVSHGIVFNGKRARLVLVSDMTARKRTEEALHQKEEQFQQAQKMEAVGRLAGGVAHDFNNLLTAILGYSELLLMSIQDQEQIRKIDQIIQVSERAALLIRQLLAFSRRQALRPEPLDVSKVVEGMEQLLHRVIGEDILLHIIQHSEQQWVKADRGQLEQVIMNLVVNARDAMPNGGELFIKTYRVTLEEGRLEDNPEARPGAFVVLGVADTGQGIDRETRERIFEPFFTTKGPGEGTGLGLSTVYGIVRQHEGWISVFSEPGRGTSFKVYLPETSIAPEEKSREALSLQDLRGQGERILVVEDEAMVREIATLMLREKGYEVVEAATVAEAVAIFEKEEGNFQMLFSDVVLSDQSGLQLVAELRARKPELRVLLTSGYADQKVQWPIIQRGNYSFLQKPYSLKDLLQSIAEVLKSDQT